VTSATFATKRRPAPTGSGLKLWIGGLVVFAILGVISGAIVLAKGLGVTGLTDRVPWGLWIALDLSMISLGAGAFTLSAIVYLLRLKRFSGIVRAAVLIGFLGYSSAMLALFLDIGRPDRFWHPLLFWNVHSVLWEITMCVMLYFTVLVVELAPVLFESPFVTKRWPAAPKVGHVIHKFTPAFAVLGLLLSLLHQSSLGATYGVVAARPLWYKPSLPVLFILSAVAGGLSVTLLGTLIVSQLRGRLMVAREVVRDMAVMAGAAMVAYLYLKLWDWAATTYYSNVTAREQVLSFLRQTTPYGETYWLIEVVLGGIVPAIIFLSPRLRKNLRLLMLAGILAIAGVVMTRWNVTISGLVVPQDWSPGVAFLFPRLSYIPTLPELGAFLGIIAYALLGFTLGVRYLPIYPSPDGGDEDVP
jgi:Ni/Fe-hydrogenase subunit HybB-like protein